LIAGVRTDESGAKHLIIIVLQIVVLQICSRKTERADASLCNHHHHQIVALWKRDETGLKSRSCFSVLIEHGLRANALSA